MKRFPYLLVPLVMIAGWMLYGYAVLAMAGPLEYIFQFEAVRWALVAAIIGAIFVLD